MGSWISLPVKGNKGPQQVMEAQPVFFLKPRLASYVSKVVSKPRGNMLSSARTVQPQLAGQVCLLGQGHAVAARDTQTCPCLHMNGKEQEESEGNSWGLVFIPQKKKLEPHIRFSFAGLKPSLSQPLHL